MSRPTSPGQQPKRRNPRTSTFRQTLSQTLSPPTSPTSPAKKAQKVRKPKQHQAMDPEQPDHDNDSKKVGSAAHLGSSQAKGAKTSAMLPTPAKTPRKRGIHQDSDIASAARVLFPNQQSEFEDILPTPQKSRKSKKYAALSLESFAEACEKDRDNVEIYTDAKDRLPDLDEGEDNPFVSKNKAAGQQAASEQEESRGRPRRTRHGMGKEIDDAVNNGEGIVYVFRGKKIFRRFTEVEMASSSNRAGEESPNTPSGQEDLRRQVGVAADWPLTKHSLEPRLLFSSHGSRKSAEQVAEEEALTDIEAHGVIPSSSKATSPGKGQSQASQHHPPETSKTQKAPGSKAKKAGQAHVDFAADSPDADSAKRGPKSSPFDAWQRTKPGLRSVSMKRQGEPLERDGGPSGKRSRSAQGL